MFPTQHFTQDDLARIKRRAAQGFMVGVSLLSLIFYGCKYSPSAEEALLLLVLCLGVPPVGQMAIITHRQHPDRSAP